MRIYLIGMPGSGKTTLGTALAEVLGWRFADLDHVIERQQGATIATIFERQGELAFRQLEKAAVAQTLYWQQVVISTGGGTPVWFDNLETMVGAGLVIWLDTPLDLVQQRLQHFSSNRPLLAQGSVAERVQQLYAERMPRYRQAHHRLTTFAQLKEVATAWVKSQVG